MLTAGRLYPDAWRQAEDMRSQRGQALPVQADEVNGIMPSYAQNNPVVRIAKCLIAEAIICPILHY